MKFLMAALVIPFSLSAMAQVEESAPQEAPFIQEDQEFDLPETNMDLRIEDEVLSAEPHLEVPPPSPEQMEESVDLNADVPEAGSSWEEELQDIEDNVVVEEQAPAVVPSEPVVERPSYSPEVMRKSAKGGVEYIHHPQAAKGLIKIEKDGTYIYQTRERTSYDSTGTLRFGIMDSPRITSADGTTTFKTMYSNGPLSVITFDYEWQPLTGFGKLGVQAGFGLILANGNGRFISDGLPAKEEYTFVAIPLSAGGIYRLQWKDRQWFAPYISGGGIYYPVAEFRDDGEGPHAVGTPGVYGAGGLMINISAMDRETAFTLSTEYGISNLWLSLEYRQVQTFSEDLDFSSGLASLGISADY